MNNNNNNNKLKLQHPDSITNNDNYFSSVTETPVLNPNHIRTDDNRATSKIINRNISLEIPKWNTFNDANNSIPTMDASPIYAKNSPDYRNRKKKKYTQRDPINYRTRIETNHNNNGDEYSNRSFLIRCCEYLFCYHT
jgi:hypothetical protein